MPAANGNRETEVPMPPNWPTALASTSTASTGTSQRAPVAWLPATAAWAKPFISLISPGRSSTSSATVATT